MNVKSVFCEVEQFMRKNLKNRNGISLIITDYQAE
jgi:hypothetical protein